MDQMLGQGGANTTVYFIIVLVYLIIYTLLSSFLQEKHSPIHRTAVAIIIGIVVGLILSLGAPDTFQEIVKLDEIIVFSVLFPPIIFAQGYTLHKSVIFKNAKYILLFGLLGTFISFLISWGLLYEANALNLVIDAGDIHNIRTLSDWEILLLAACLCSIDTTASEESVSQYRYPRLYSIIFGEDVVKDAVTIVLFKSILNLQTNESPDKLVIYWYTFFEVLLNFLIFLLGSVAISFFSAGLAIYLNKRLRFIGKDHGITETAFLFLIGFANYIATQYFGFSGSISLLLYGILLNHYNVYNISDQSYRTTVSTFTLLSNISEGLLFLIMGIMVCQGDWQSPDSSSDNMTHSYIFFLIVMIILCFVRFVNVYVLGIISRKFFRKAFTIYNEELHILFLSGLVRGAIPFVLFSSVAFTETSSYGKNEGIVLKTTIIFVIAFTSVILNSFIPHFCKRKLRKISNLQRQNLLCEMRKSEQQKSNLGKIRQLEEKYIKPFLIFDYLNRKKSICEKKQRRLKEAQDEALALFDEQQGEQMVEKSQIQ